MDRNKDFSEFPPSRRGGSRILTNHLNTLQSLINAIPIPIFFKDADGIFVACNLAFEELSGIRKADITVNDYVRNVVKGDDETGETDLSTDREVLSSGSSRIYNTVFCLGPNRAVQVVVTKTPLMDESGDVKGIFGVVLNAAHEDHMNTHSADAEARYRPLSDDSVDGVLLLTPDGEILSANQAACRIFGRTEEELQKTGRNSIIDLEDPRFFAALTERDRTGTTTAEHFHVRKDGTKFLARVSSNTFRDTSGRLLASTIIRDITQLKKAEEETTQDAERYAHTIARHIRDRGHLASETARNEKRYRDIYNNISEGIFQISKQGKFISANPSLATILGYGTPLELVRLVARVADLWASRDDFRVLLRRLETDRRVSNFEVRVRKRAGDLCWISINVYIVSDDHGKSFYEGTLVDIGARKAVEDSLREQTALLEDTTAALRVLLKQREQDKFELEHNIASNLGTLVFPYLSKLKTMKLTEQQSAFVSIIKNNLSEITAPFTNKMKLFGLTATELTVINLIKNGSTTKDIMAALAMSKEAVDLHRYHIRKKLGITNKKVNLQAHLKSVL